MICETCYCVLRGQTGRQWRGTFDLRFVHQKAEQSLSLAAGMGCCFCRLIWSQMMRVGDDKRVLNEANSRGHLINAYLSEVRNQQDLYRLDFKSGDAKLATFLLQQSINRAEFNAYTPRADNTAAEEVLRLARYWISKCTSDEHHHCPDENFSNGARRHRAIADRRGYYPTRLTESRSEVPFPGKRYYPTRLIELPSEVPFSIQAARDMYVRLIEKEEAQSCQGHYVTLSHCWGKSKFLTLRTLDLKRFKEGIPMQALPPRFQEAIHFARRLSRKVRYIWIDSLCIIQDDPEDWARESVQMYNVYRNSYCNISATAAGDTQEGLYSARNPQRLWEEEVFLNTEGIPQAGLKRKMSEHSEHSELGPLIRRCSVQDVSFWNRQVDEAPINRRAWVFQERLLAPRVLYFCRDQIAWECRQLDAAESFPFGISDLELQAGKIQRRVRVKTLLPDTYGYQSIGLNLNEVSDKAHENWKRIIEWYTRTQITRLEDQLIAVAGIAEMMATSIRGKYLAGLWEYYYASQLLWRIDPVYKNSEFEHPSRRPLEYTAPSFSWAAVHAPQGIRLGETIKEEKLLFNVEKIHVATKSGEEFGLILDDCYLEITCDLFAIELGRSSTEAAGAVRYLWNFPGVTEQEKKIFLPLVYLDSPYDDFADIQGPAGALFFVPASMDDAKYLTGLLLQTKQDGHQRYRRVGLTRIPPYNSEMQSALDRQAKEWHAT